MRMEKKNRWGDNAIMRSRISERAFLGLGVLANRAFGKPFGGEVSCGHWQCPGGPRWCYISLRIAFVSKLQILLPLNLNLFDAHAAAKIAKGLIYVQCGLRRCSPVANLLPLRFNPRFIYLHRWYWAYLLPELDCSVWEWDVFSVFSGQIQW